MKIWCRICDSESPESQERLREIARLGLVRFLVIARKARVQVTMEQQRAIYSALLYWDCVGMPTEVDLLIHEYADRAACSGSFSTDVEKRLIAVRESMPAWNANWRGKPSWNIPAEHRIADQLEPLLRDVDEWNIPGDPLAAELLKQYRAGRDDQPDLRNDAVDPEGDDID